MFKIIIIFGAFFVGLGSTLEFNNQKQHGGYSDRDRSIANVDPTRSFSNNPDRFNQYNRNSNNRDVNNYRPAPDRRYQDIQILRNENVNHGNGHYNYFYETSDGTVASQKGYLKAPRSVEDGAGIQGAEGFYQYYSPEGQLLRVDYTADENGFRPKGDHLPTPPPIPEAIKKSLDLIYANIEKQKLNPNPYRREYNFQERYKNQAPYGQRQ